MLGSSGCPCLLTSGSATCHALDPTSRLPTCRGTLRELPSPDQAAQAYARMPPFLERALMPFQRDGVRFGLARGGRCLLAGALWLAPRGGGSRLSTLRCQQPAPAVAPCCALGGWRLPLILPLRPHPPADEMGVGKTVQAIALASCYQDEWPLLVVAPASLRLVWAEELEKWLPHLRPGAIHVIEGKEHRLAQVGGAGRGPGPGARAGRQLLQAVPACEHAPIRRCCVALPLPPGRARCRRWSSPRLR